MKKYFAHTLPPANWQPLEEYLRNAADLAIDFINKSLIVANSTEAISFYA
jgi:hypothetical protein